VLAPGSEAAARPGERGESESRGRPGAEAADACERAASVPESAAGAGFGARRGLDSGGAWGGGGADAQSGDADGVCAAIDPARGGEAVSERERGTGGVVCGSAD